MTSVMEDQLHKQKIQQHTSRLWLEGKSTGELTEIADSYGIDIPAGLERIFIIEEILECANADDQTEKEDIVVNPSYSESVLLPKQYNISFIEVKIRDPLWAFVFWEIKSHDREIHEKTADFNSYCLHVIPLNEENKIQEKDNSFTVLINPEDSARYLGFAEHSAADSRRYIIKLIALRGDSEYQIACSLPFELPKLYEDEIFAEESRNPLIRLSGIQDLSITKNTDRQSRIRRN